LGQVVAGIRVTVHRDLEITVDPAATNGLLDELRRMDGVITLSVRAGESVKPPGDVSATVLNSEADAVLGLVVEAEEQGSVSVTTASVDSVIDTDNQLAVRGDVDEASWEEAETAMRRHTRPTFNFFATTALGGVMTCSSRLGTRSCCLLPAPSPA
jgi:hypothetical protein